MSATVDWVEGNTIGQVLRETAARFGSRSAIVFSREGYRATWAEFDAQVDALAKGLLSLGLRVGDHLAIWCTNRPEWVLLQFATARVGVVLVNINPAYRTSELEYALKQSDAKVLALIDCFKTSNYFDMLAEVAPEVRADEPGQLSAARFPKLKWILALSPGGPRASLGWNDLLERGRAVRDDDLRAREAELDPHQAVNIQYTSGTTGFPKGATLSHRNLLMNVLYAGECQRLTEEDKICIPVPLYHCFGCVLGSLCAVVHGAAMIFPHEYFVPAATLDAIEKERATAIYGVPTMFIAELEDPTYPGRDLSSLRTGIMAGSPCPIELMRRVTGEMGASQMTIGYGLTEASPLLTQTRTDDPIERRVGTVGRCLPGVEVKIIDPQTGKALGPGETGELCGRGHGIMIGYYNMPEATEHAIDTEGWLRTGDLAVLEPNGYYRITGRQKDMIIRGGENIYPREIEEFLYTHPAIEEVQVVGVPSVKYGEEVLAWIKPRAGHTLTEEEVRSFCQGRLAHFKVPKYIKFVDAYPLTVTGKIQKFKIREQAIRELGLESAAGIETA